MAINTQKFDKWIKKHKLFAIAAPIILMLLVFFVVTSLQSMTAKQKESLPDNGYNNSLPNQKNELKVKEPNEYYKQSLKDSLEELRQKGRIQNINGSTKENDSLGRILEELNNFSLDETQAETEIVNNTEIVEPINTEFVSKKTAAQEKLEYRKLLMEARDERLARSQDYSAPQAKKSVDPSISSVHLDASIYRDQFVLPGNRVTLILREDAYYNGKTLPKNTFVYATANIQGSRVLLDITNINKVPMALTAIDQEDGMTGLHNERANQLIQEFKTDIQEQGLNELSETIDKASEGPLANNLVRSFGNFFTKKRYKQRDKILLVNGDRVFLISKNQLQ